MAVFLFHLKLVHGDGPITTAAPSTYLERVQVESSLIPGKFLWAESTEEGSSVQLSDIKDEWRLHPGPYNKSYYLECVRAGKFLKHTGSWSTAAFISSETSAETLWYVHDIWEDIVVLEQAHPHSEYYQWLYYDSGPVFPKIVQVFRNDGGGMWKFTHEISCGPLGALVARIQWMLMVIGIFAW